MKTCLILVACLGLAAAQSNFATNQLTSSALGERPQRALFPSNSYILPVATGLPASNIVDNAAARQLQADKSAFPFLATLPNQGSSNFFTVLKPCGLILFHLHPRATEQYLIISGSQLVGIAEENGGRQNLTFTASAGQIFVVPQGLIHFNANQQCTPNVFVQSFSSSDAGTLGLTNVLASFNHDGPAASVVAAANYTTVASSPFGAFALDQTCLQRCGLPSTGGGLSGLSQELQIFLGLANSTASPTTGVPTTGVPARAPGSGSGPTSG